MPRYSRAPYLLPRLRVTDKVLAAHDRFLPPWYVRPLEWYDGYS